MPSWVFFPGCKNITLLLTRLCYSDKSRRLRLPLPRMGHCHSRGENSFKFQPLSWNILWGIIDTCAIVRLWFASRMVYPRWEARIKFPCPFDILIVCITQIKKSWRALEPTSPKILSSAPFLPIYDPIEKCTTTHLSCKNGWISITGKSTQVGDRERGNHRCIYYFSIKSWRWSSSWPLKMILALTLMIELSLQAKNLINQMLTVNPAKRIRAEEVSDFLIFFPNKVQKSKVEEKNCWYD